MRFSEAVRHALMLVGRAADMQRVALFEYVDGSAMPGEVWWRIASQWRAASVSEQGASPHASGRLPTSLIGRSVYLAPTGWWTRSLTTCAAQHSERYNGRAVHSISLQRRSDSTAACGGGWPWTTAARIDDAPGEVARLREALTVVRSLLRHELLAELTHETERVRQCCRSRGKRCNMRAQRLDANGCLI